MFGRELKTKLPELRKAENVLDKGVRDRDWSHKMTHKIHANNKRGAATSPVKSEDLVLLKNTKTSRKLSAHFESEPYTVQAKEGSEVTVRSKKGIEYRRNSFFVKPYNLPEEPKDASENADQEAVSPAHASSPAKEVLDNPLPVKEVLDNSSRPRRTMRMPAKYKDYVLTRVSMNSVETLNMYGLY